MENNAMYARKRLQQYRINNDLIEYIDVYCSNVEQEEYGKLLNAGKTLPEGILERYQSDGTIKFCRKQEQSLNDKEIMEYLAFQQVELLQSINKYLKFFYISAIISIAIAIIISLISLF